MMSCLAHFSGFADGSLLSSSSAATGLIGGIDAVSLSLIEPGLIVGQAMKWLPAWLTPIWLIAVGLALGAIAALVFYAALGILSLVVNREWILRSIPFGKFRKVTGLIKSSNTKTIPFWGKSKCISLDLNDSIRPKILLFS